MTLLVPVNLFDPTGSTAGNVPISSGPGGPTVWGALPYSALSNVPVPAREVFNLGTGFSVGATSITLSGTYGSVNNITVHFNGVYQSVSALQSLVGKVLTFTNPIPNGVNAIYVDSFTIPAMTATPPISSVGVAQLAADALNYPSSAPYTSSTSGSVAQTIRGALDSLRKTLRTFGAKGDGVTDDTSALAAAIASGVSIQGVPGDTYLVNSTGLVFSGVSNLEWIGNGATIIFNGVPSSNPNGMFSTQILITNTNNFEFSDWILNGNGQVSNLIGCYGNTNLNIDNNTLTNGGYLAQLVVFGDTNTSVTRNVIYNGVSTARGIWAGNYATLQINTNINVSGNTVYSHNASGIVVASYGGKILGNTSYSNKGSGIVFGGANSIASNGITIEGNEVYNNLFHGIQTDVTYKTILDMPSGITITGNISKANNNNGGSAGIYAAYLKNSVISSNSCTNNDYEGIHVEGSFDLQIANNSCLDDRAAGARTQVNGICIISQGLPANTARINVVGNTCSYNTNIGIRLVNTSAVYTLQDISVTGNSANYNAYGISVIEADPGDFSRISVNSNNTFGNSSADIRLSAIDVSSSGNIYSTQIGYEYYPLTAASTTPAVGNRSKWLASNSVATSINNFTGAPNGAVIQIYSTNTNTTINNTAAIVNPNGANIPIPAGGVVTYTNYDGVWYYTSASNPVLNLTGPITSVGTVTSVASQTGTGSKFVMDTAPTLNNPNINGNLGLGGISPASILNVTGSGALSGASQIGGQFTPIGTTSGTSYLFGLLTYPITAASTTVASVGGLNVFDAVKGTGGTINNQYGIFVQDQTKGGNNYGIYLNVSSGAGKWGVYANGNAAWSIGGNVGIGTGTATPANPLTVVGTASATNFVGGGSGLTGIIASQIGFTQTGTGGTNRTVSSKLYETVSIADFGAVGNGTTDDTAAINAALAASKHVVVPAGFTSLISSTIVVPAYSRLTFMGGSGNTSTALPASYFLMKSTMSTTGITVAAGSVIEYGGVVGQSGNSADGIAIVGNSAKLIKPFVALAGGNGIRVGTTGGANVNDYILENPYCVNNTGHGIFVHDGNTSGISNANAGLITQPITNYNTGDGVHLGNAYWTTIISGNSEVNTGWGLYISGNNNNSYPECRYTSIIGGDYNEGNTAGQVYDGGYFSQFIVADHNSTTTAAGSGLQGSGLRNTLSPGFNSLMGLNIPLTATYPFQINSNTMTFPSTAAVIARTDAGQTFTGNQTVTGSITTSTDSKFNGQTVGLGGGAISTNTALGFQSLYKNTTGSGNLASGYQSLFNATTASSNTAVGYYSLVNTTTGGGNTALGYQAGYTTTAANANTTGSNNTWIGVNSGPGVATQLSNSTAIGANALNTASNQIVLGANTVTSVVTSGNITAPSFIGSGSSLTGITTGQVGYTPSGTGAQAQTLTTKLNQQVSVFDFMTAAQIADCVSGAATIDATSSIQAAINYCCSLALVGGVVYFPAGSYKITSEIFTYSTTATGQCGIRGAGRYATRFLPSSDFTAFNIVSSCVDSGDFSIEWPATAATSARIGVEFANGNYQVSYSTIYNITVVNPYRGFVLNNWSASSYGTMYLVTLKGLSAINNSDWGFWLNSKSGSTTLLLEHCYVKGAGSGSTSKGIYVNSFNDVSTLSCAIDTCVDNWFHVVNHNTLNHQSLALESNFVSTVGQYPVWINGSQSVIAGVKVIGTTYNTGGVAYTIFLGGSSTLSISGYNEQYSTITTGTRYKLALNSATASASVLDNSILPADVNNNGWYASVNFNGNLITTTNLAPNYGSWVAGQKVRNGSPVAGGSEGWVCTVSGSPGTWVPFGTVSFIQTGTGAKTQLVSAKLQQVVSVLDFTGADPTGATDSTAAFQAAISSGALTIVVPEGTYLVSTSLYLKANQMLVGQNQFSSIINWRPANGSSVACIRNVATNFNCGVSNLTINSTSLSNYAIQFYSSFSNKVTNVSLTGSWYLGVLLDTTYCCSLDSINTAGASFSAFIIAISNNSNKHVISKLYTTGYPASAASCLVGIAIQGGYGHSVLDCTLQGQTIGIFLGNPIETLISNPYFENTLCCVKTGDNTKSSNSANTVLLGGMYIAPYNTHPQYASAGPMIYTPYTDDLTIQNVGIESTGNATATPGVYPVLLTTTTLGVKVDNIRHFQSNARQAVMKEVAGANASLTIIGGTYGTYGATEMVLKCDGSYATNCYGIQISNTGVVSTNAYTPTVVSNATSSLILTGLPTISSLVVA